MRAAESPHRPLEQRGAACPLAAAWADTVNRCLERSGHEERVNHRSHAERGLDEQPTIHEGIAARALEKKGIISDRCEMSRQIKSDNALLRELKSLVKKLMDTVENTIPALAERQKPQQPQKSRGCEQER